MHDEPSKPLGKPLREVFSEEEKQKPAPPSGEGASSLDAETRRLLAQMQVPRLYRGDGPPPTNLPPAQAVLLRVEPPPDRDATDDAKAALALVCRLLLLLDKRTLVRPVLFPADLNPGDFTTETCLIYTKQFLKDAVRVVQYLPLASEIVSKATEKVRAEPTPTEAKAEQEQAFANVAPKVAKTFRGEPLSPPPSPVAIQWVADAQYIRDQLHLRPLVRDFLIYAGKLKDCQHDDC